MIAVRKAFLIILVAVAILAAVSVGLTQIAEHAGPGAATAPPGEITITDSLGRSVTLPYPVKSIVVNR